MSKKEWLVMVAAVLLGWLSGRAERHGNQNVLVDLGNLTFLDWLTKNLK